MRARLVVICLALLVPAEHAVACSISGFDVDDRIENTPVFSGNGRYCAIVRDYDIPDFQSERAGKVLRIDPEYEGQPAPARPDRWTIAWYEVVPAGHRLIAEIAVDRLSDDVLVSDSGRYLVTTRRIHAGPCSGSPKPDDRVITVYQSNGARVGSLTPLDVLVASDIDFGFESRDESFSLRDETLVLTFTGTGGPAVERRIDLATLALLDTKEPVYPVPRGYAAPASGEAKRPVGENCAAWPRDNLLRVDPSEFFKSVVDAPLPPFPQVAAHSRISVTLRAQFIVSERGSVECVSVGSFPFGFTDAVVAAARSWRFRPFSDGTHRVKAIGTIDFHFAPVAEAAWQAMLVPPFRVSDAAALAPAVPASSSRP